MCVSAPLGLDWVYGFELYCALYYGLCCDFPVQGMEYAPWLWDSKIYIVCH